ncbi:MAG: hypothetical protein AB4080_12170 [Trichodesmium sp.]
MTSSPYQSKVLNFISAKYRQILTQRDRVFSHLKFAASNTVQLLLYPMYVLLQGSRLAAKRLREKVIFYLPHNREKVKNQTIKNNQIIDQQIQPVEVLVAKANLASTSIPSCRIKPEVFSELEKTEETLISEILSNEKKEYPRQSDTAKIDRKMPLQLQPCAELVPMFGPLGLVWQIMAWVETSKIALWFNLFEEWNIVLEESQLNQQSFFSYQNQRLLSSANLTFREFIHNLAKQYLYPITRGLGLNGLLPPFQIEEELEIDSILEAELDQGKQQKSAQVIGVTVLPYESKTETSQVATSLNLANTTPIRPSQEKLDNQKNFHSNQPSHKTIFNSHNSVKKEPSRFKKTLAKTSGHQTELDIDNTVKTPEVALQTYRAEDRPKHQPNWLEVESISIGYVKHPLEIILSWVDVIMTWVEKVVEQVWQWSQQQKSKNF